MHTFNLSFTNSDRKKYIHAEKYEIYIQNELKVRLE